MKRIATLTVLFCISCFLQAQNISFDQRNFPNDVTGFESALSKYDKGDHLFFQGPQFFSSALPYYLEANKFNPDNADLNFKIGKILKHLNRLHDAEPYFMKAIALDDNPMHQLEGEITLAEVIHLEGKWDDAIAAYRKYISWVKVLNPKKVHLHAYDLQQFIRNAEMKIRQCENGKNLTMDTIPILLENMGKAINTAYPEYSAVINQAEDFMVFTSRRPGSTGEKMPPNEVWQYEDIYYSRRTKEGWQQSLRLPGEVNSDNHEAPVWLSANGEKMIIYRPTNNGDLYFSELKEGIWTKPEPIPHVNSAYRETHASMSPDGKTIYFTSDNPKYERIHLGEKNVFHLDIYKIEWDSVTNHWREPVPVEELNTEFDEECPFISADGKRMYFSSQGHYSIGGFDIFKSDLVNGKFSPPQNIGYPINSAYNDIFIFFSTDGKRGFFDSDRSGGLGEKDIYEMFILSAVKIPLVVEVYDRETGELITANVKVTEQGKDKKNVALTESKTGVLEGNLSIFKGFQIIVDAPGYLPNSGTFHTRLKDIGAVDTTIIRYKAYLEQDKTPVTIKGRLIDKVSGSLVPGKIDVSLEQRNVADADARDGMYQLELPPRKTYVLTAVAGRYLPQQFSWTLDSSGVHDFYLERVYVGASFSMNNIYFKTGKTDVADSSMVELELLKRFLEENPQTTVEISAHTDNIGSHAFNQTLSEKRARVVVNWLVSKGISRTRITSKGYSYDKPVATNDTPDGRSLNRRVEVKVTDTWD